MNAGFLIVMIIGVVLGEVYFPLEGVRGRGVALFNDTNCMNEMAGKMQSAEYSWMEK